MHSKRPWLLIVAMLPAVVSVGCGSVDAGDRQTADAPGFWSRLFEPERQPVVVPAGTLLALRLENALSSHQTPRGATFAAVVTQEVSVEGLTAIPVGSIVRGHVAEAHAPGKIGGRAVLSLAFDELETPAGNVVPIAAELARAGKSEVAKDAALIGGGALGGAILGEAIHEGEGGTVGALVGGIAGAIGAKKTQGKPVVLSSGTALHITLASDVTLEVRS